MKLFRYQNFIKESKEDIESICSKYVIENYTINDDGTIDVDGDVLLYIKELTELPLKFRKVSGNFWCNNNKLTSLEGAPREVGGDFWCSENKLTSLSGAPREVGGGFYCHSNKLLSLEGISQRISGNINCRDNELRDVRGIKDGWSGRFSVKGNPVFEIFKLFPQERWDEVIEFLNEFDVIREGRLVILQGIEQIFLEMDLEVPEIDQIEGYDIQF